MLCERCVNARLPLTVLKWDDIYFFYVSLPKSGMWRCLFDFSVMFFFFITLMTWNTDYSKSLICWALWIVFQFPWDLRNTANLIIVMDSHSNLCWAHSDTVGFFWDRLEKKARLALIVYAHINKQIYYDLSFICSNCLIPSVNSSDWTHLRVCVLSSCVRVCVLVLFMGRRRRRQTLLPSRKSWKKQTRWSQFDLSWITGHYLNMTRERHPGCDQTACRAVSRCMLAMFNAFQVLLLFWFNLLVPTCHIILINLNQQHTYRTYCLYGIMHRECAFHRWIGETDQLADL